MKRVSLATTVLVAGLVVRTYAGQRDPFVKVVKHVPAPPIVAPRPAGLAGLSLAEVTVRGIARSPSAPTAILEGDNQSFIAHPNDRLFDAVVYSIENEEVVFATESGPARTVLVRKALHSAEPAQ